LNIPSIDYKKAQLILIVLAFVSFPQTKAWTKICVSGMDDHANAIAADPKDGGLYVTGITKGNLNCGIFSSGKSHVGTGDIFLVKYGGNGGIRWSTIWGTYRSEGAKSVRVDTSGNAFVMGSVDNSTKEYPGQYEIAVLKYNPSGGLVWEREIHGEGVLYSGDFVMDATGNMYFTGTANDTSGNPANFNNRDIRVIKCDSSLNVIWSKRYGSPDADWGNGIAIDSSGCLYVVGTCMAPIDGQPFAGEIDIVVMKLDNNGTRLWTRTVGTKGVDYGTKLVLDRRGNVLVAGSTDGSLCGQPHHGKNDALLLKYNKDGDLVWARLWGTVEDDFAFNLIADTADDIYVSGGSMAIGNGNENASECDIILLKYTCNGDRQWVRSCGLRDGKGMAIALDRVGDIYIAGSAKGLPSQTDYPYDICMVKFRPFAPSFNCDEATSLQENMICEDAVLSALDNRMDSLYKKGMKISPDKNKFLANQATWLKTQRNLCLTKEQLGTCMAARVIELEKSTK